MLTAISGKKGPGFGQPPLMSGELSLKALPKWQLLRAWLLSSSLLSMTGIPVVSAHWVLSVAL